MSVYVDNARIKFKSMIMCHMMGDTLSELHSMAEKIGLKREWFQAKSSPHYDVCLSRRELAIEYGAIEIGNKQVVALIKRYKKSQLQ